jgi:ATP-binding cassette subfamily B protein
MNHPNKIKENLLYVLPRILQKRLQAEVASDTVQAIAQHDLDNNGMYINGYLILTKTRLGYFCHKSNSWNGQWRAIEEFTSVAIIEGLRMSILRLLANETIIAEYRFTLRHTQSVSKLHYQLECQIEGKKESRAIPEETKLVETKVRCDKCQRVIPSWSDICPTCLCRRKVLSRLMDFVKPYKLQVLAGLSLTVLITLAGLARPYLTKPMLNQGLGADPGLNADYNMLIIYILMLAGLTLFVAIGGAIRHRIMASLGSRIARDVRNKTYDHLHKLSLSFFSQKTTGSLITRITSDSDRIWDFVAFTIVEMAIAFLTIMGIGLALFIMNWKLACFALIPIPMMIVLMIIFHRKLHRFFHRKFHRWSQMTSIVSDAIPGIRIIKAFSQEKSEILRFMEKNHKVYESELTLINVFTIFDPALQICGQIGSLIIWGLGGYWAVRGDLDVGTLMAFICYMWMFYGPIQMLSHMDRMLNQAATSVQRIFEILDTEPTIFSKRRTTPPDEIDGEIELRDVSFSYDGIRKVLKNINIRVRPGETISLVGPSGGGKTTLANLIFRFYDVLEGQILIDGIDVKNYDIEVLRRHIGFVLQEPFLFHSTVAKNITYGKPDATIDKIITAARIANAHDFIVGFPDGYETLVGERGHTLSGGERQRISIARAILNNPSILILDEATSSVDAETENVIQETMGRLISNRTTIIIAHRLSTLRKADRLVVLDKGEIIEQGSPQELISKKNGLYAKLYRMQTKR